MEEIEPTEIQLKQASDLVENMVSQSNKVDILEIANKIAREKKHRIEEGVNKQFTSSTLDAFDMERTESGDNNEDIAHEQLVLFVSASMPMKTLRNYARDLAKVGGVMVVRGMKNGLQDYVSGMRFFWDVLRVDKNCNSSTCESFATDILVDPILFSMYDIEVVPALVYQPDMKLNSYCDDISLAQKADGIVYGDFYLGYLLEQLEKETKNPILKTLAKRLN